MEDAENKPQETSFKWGKNPFLRVSHGRNFSHTMEVRETGHEMVQRSFSSVHLWPEIIKITEKKPPKTR